MYYSHRPKVAKTFDEKEWRAFEYRKLRRHLSLTQRGVAELTGLSYNTVRQLPSLEQNRIPSLYVLELMRAEIERKPFYQKNGWEESKSSNERALEARKRYAARYETRSTPSA
ncbi:hypothetical protein F9K96_01090 [Brucella anthropi]|uniref:hypothetical protein n=1 Tax=Brucella/Ochrobactrum group TaxID=2826938 RepID=UPI00111EA13A|nr:MULTISPECIES: hypothetical protein [Brucella/Ochrobactrum group]KAB2793799.1 hypothetical protein F9K96_01090 [Brucella anthropi]